MKAHAIYNVIMSNNNWRMGIKERGARHLWPEDMWYVVGY